MSSTDSAARSDENEPGAGTRQSTHLWHRTVLRGEELLCVRLSYPRRDTVVCTASGEVDIVSAPRLGAALGSATSCCARHIVVDLSAVTFFGARGLGVLAQVAQDAQGRQRVLIVAADGSTVARVMTLAGLADLIPRYADLRTALVKCADPHPQRDMSPWRAEPAPRGASHRAGTEHDRPDHVV